MPEESTQTVTNAEPMECKLGDLILPVPPKQMSIRQSLKIDEIEIPGRSGKIKQPVGYEDSTITIELELCPQEDNGKMVKTAQERLKEIQTLFRPSEKAIQTPLSIVSTLTESCGIKQVLIKDIEVKDDEEYDLIHCSLTLTEFDSIENQLQEQAQAAQAAQQAVSTAEENMPAELQSPPDDYLLNQYNQGKSDALGGEYSGETPGDDSG